MADLPVPYADLSERWWGDFNDVYLVIYPPEREAEVLSVLGPDADEARDLCLTAQKALEKDSYSERARPVLSPGTAGASRRWQG